MQEIVDKWLSLDEVYLLLDPLTLVYFFFAVAIFFIAKKANNIFVPYDLDHELIHKDNKAIAMSFAGYILGVSIIVSGLFSQEFEIQEGSTLREQLFGDLASSVLWSIIGVGLLQLARLVNDTVLLHRFQNVKELVDDQNVGTGVIQFASYVGSALVVRASLSGEDSISLGYSIMDTFVYFWVCQLAFIVFGVLYQKITVYDYHDEIEKDNIAAGVAFGSNLIAVAIILSGYLMKYDSLPGMCIWLFAGMLLIITGRYMIDKWILPGGLLDDEISKDRNWGAAIVEGTGALGIAFVLVAVL